MTSDPRCSPVVFEREGRIFANSRDVAAFFEKAHKHVLEAIDNLLKELAAEISATLFIKSLAFDAAANRETRSFDMTRDGFMLLVMSFTGPKALQFKLRYMEQFNEMEAALKSAHLGSRKEPVQDFPLAAMAGAGRLTSREANAFAKVVSEARRIAGRSSAVVVWCQTPLPALPGYLPDMEPAVMTLDIDGEACLARLLRARVDQWTRGRRGHTTIGALIRLAQPEGVIRNSLIAIGIQVDPVNWSGWVAIAEDHPRLRPVFVGSPWAAGWTTVMLSVPGARPAESISGFDRSRRCVLIPREAVEAHIADLDA